MRIAIAGGTGFIGAPLVRQLLANGDDVAVLSRNPSKVRAGRGVEWHPPKPGLWTAEVQSADVVINLAGESIGDRRWTESRKRTLLASRIEPTGALVAAMQDKPDTRRLFLSVSAVGYYGLHGDEMIDEAAPAGDGFLAEITKRWETAAREVGEAARLVIPRFGVVLDSDGGALAKMRMPFRFGVGGPVGTGRQWMSWIARDDVLGVVRWAIANPDARGAYNVTSPEPVRNLDFSHALGRALHRPALISVPAFVLRILFGEMADEVLLGGQRVVPLRLQREGFEFSLPEIQKALDTMFNRTRG
jgi:uncharacterized protein